GRLGHRLTGRRDEVGEVGEVLDDEAGLVPLRQQRGQLRGRHERRGHHEYATALRGGGDEVGEGGSGEAGEVGDPEVDEARGLGGGSSHRGRNVGGGGFLPVTGFALRLTPWRVFA